MTPTEHARTLGRNYRAAAITIRDQSPLALLPRVVERIWRDYVTQWPELQGQHDAFMHTVMGGDA